MCKRPLTSYPFGAALMLAFPGLLPAQQFLLTVEEQDQHFIALIDTRGKVLSQRPPSASPVGNARFYRGARWATLEWGSTGVSVYDDRGLLLDTIPTIGGWNGFDTFPDGRLAIREPWSTYLIYVIEASGSVLNQWPFDLCAGGPEFGLRAAPGNELWATESCGAVVRRYDVNGVLLGELDPTLNISSLWNDTNDDFLPAPDGTLWVLESWGSQIHHYDWSGALLHAFDGPDASSGIALDADGCIWARDDAGHALLRYDDAGTLLDATPYADDWQVWSMDLRDGRAVGSSYCGPAVPNSTGVGASIEAFDYQGSPFLELRASDLPAGQAVLFLVGPTQNFVPFIGGSSGTLCIGGGVGRYAGDVQVAGSDGRAGLTIDTAAIPTPTGALAVQPGDTWHWQAWFRDFDLTPTSNLTDGVAVSF